MRSPLLRLLTVALTVVATTGATSQAPWPVAGADVAGMRDAQGWPVTPNLNKVGRGELVPTSVVGEFLGRVDEGKEAVVRRAALTAMAYTDARGFEACARVCEDGQGRVGLRLTTNHSQLACKTAQDATACPVGFSPTSETLHTHPQVSQVFANPVDAIFVAKKRGQRLIVRPEGFSDVDLRNHGGGYLVTGGRLLHHNGSGAQQEIGAVTGVLHAVDVSP